MTTTTKERRRAPSSSRSLIILCFSNALDSLARVRVQPPWLDDQIEAALRRSRRELSAALPLQINHYQPIRRAQQLELLAVISAV